MLSTQAPRFILHVQKVSRLINPNVRKAVLKISEEFQKTQDNQVGGVGVEASKISRFQESSWSIKSDKVYVPYIIIADNDLQYAFIERVRFLLSQHETAEKFKSKWLIQIKSDKGGYIYIWKNPGDLP